MAESVSKPQRMPPDDGARKAGAKREARAREEKDAAAAVRTVTCASCQKVVLDREAQLTSHGVLCARCLAEE